VKLEYFEYLIDFAIAAEKWSFLDKLSEDAADCPNINAQAVLTLPEKHLGSTVPKCFNFMS
jgi:hypothetical protein